MRTLSYSDFSSRIHSASLKKRIPLDVGLDLTYRCNNRCVHCYCSLPESDEEAIGKELTTAEIKKTLDKLAAMGSLWLLISGGEPLLRPDFEEIYLHAKKKGFLITLFTNGTLIDDRIIGILSARPPFAVEISIYGATRGTYEKVARVEGSYNRCMDGIEKILHARIVLKLKTMALTTNQHEIEDMDRMARQLGCEFRFDPIIQKRIDGRRFSEPEKYRISSHDVVKLDMMFPGRMKEWREFCDKFLGKPQANERLYTCGAGLGSMHINPYGSAGGCMMMATSGFSVREHEMGWIWDEGIASAVSQPKNFRLPCDVCHLANLCDQCTPWRLLETGDIKKEVAYLCQIAKMRAAKFDFVNYRMGEGNHEEKMVKA